MHLIEQQCKGGWHGDIFQSAREDSAGCASQQGCRQFEDVFQLLQRVNLEELYPKFEQEEVDMDAGGLPGLSGLVKDLHKEQGTNKQLRAALGRMSWCSPFQLANIERTCRVFKC